MQLVGLFLLMALAGATEGAGLILLVPVLGLVQGGTTGNPLAQRLALGLESAGLPVSLAGLLTLFVLLIALRSLVQYLRDRMSAHIQHEMVDRVRHRCFAALLGAEWRWFVTTRQTDHVNLLLTEAGRAGHGFSNAAALVASTVTMLCYGAAAAFLSPTLTGLVCFSGAVLIALAGGNRRQALRLGYRQIQVSRALQATVQDGLAGLRMSKLLGNEAQYLRQFDGSMEQLREQQMLFVCANSRSRGLFQTGSAVLLALYVYTGLQIWHIPVPQLLTIILIFARLAPMFMVAQQNLHFVLHAIPALSEAVALLERCEAEAEPPAIGQPPLRPWPVSRGVQLEGVSFRYRDREGAAIDKVSLHFAARTTTAIMGESGAGKSTLADIVMGLIAPDTGVLSVDGEVICGDRRREWRHSVAYVPQDVFLFNDTIRANLLWARPEATEAELRQVLDRAACGFIDQLPQGIDTMTGDGGVRLSGGEKQRLAIARALLKRPALLILDEATSSLDRENEARVRDAVEQLQGELTVIIIGHRLPTLEHADQVVVMRQGRVIEQGTWAHILNRSAVAE